MTSRTKSFKAALASLVMLTTFGIFPVFANTITVTNTGDSGAGSLRDAISSAVSGDTIDFSSTILPGTISLTTGYLLIDKNLTITGPGPSSLAIDGSHASRVFFVGGSGLTVNISGVTMQNGAPGTPNFDGGAILNNPNTLILTNCKISGNTASSGGGIHTGGGTVTLNNSTVSGNTGSQGGGIYNPGGTVTLNNSTVSGNISSGTGGAINNFHNGIAASVTLNNSTISGNSAMFQGGGILSQGVGTPVLTLNNTTLSGNSSTSGAGYGGGIAFQGTLSIKNTIVANSGAGGNCTILTGGTATSYGHNISDDGTCSTFFTQTGDLNSIAAELDSSGLANNGGPTQTIALRTTSPAVDAIPLSPTNNCTAVDGTTPISTDQRGITRPQGSNCDTGAFELVQTSLTISINNIPASAVFGGTFKPTYAYTGDGRASVTSGTPTVCSVMGPRVNFVASGTCTLTAHASAGMTSPAVDGSPQSFVIAQATTTISIKNLPKNARTGGSFTPTYIYTGDGTTSVTSSTASCTVSGNVVNFVASGTCTLTAHATAGINYAAAEGNSQSFTIK
jgi:hypothetical protein